MFFTDEEKESMEAEIAALIRDAEQEGSGNENSDDEDPSEKQPEESSSSGESFSGDMPRGWKRRVEDLDLDVPTASKKLCSLGEIGPDETDSNTDGVEDSSSVNCMDDDDDEGESIGSVDDEMVEALEKEFGN